MLEMNNLVLEADALVLETSILKQVFELQLYTKLATTNFTTGLMSRCLLVKATHLKNGCYHAEEIEKVSRCKIVSSIAIN